MVSSKKADNSDTLSLSPESTGFRCVVCPPPPSTGACRWVSDHILALGLCLHFWLLYMDCPSQILSVPPRLCVHYLDVVPVEVWPVLRLWVMRAGFSLPIDADVLCSFHLVLNFLDISFVTTLASYWVDYSPCFSSLLTLSLGATSDCLSVYLGFRCRAMSCFLNTHWSRSIMHCTCVVDTVVFWIH